MTATVLLLLKAFPFSSTYTQIQRNQYDQYGYASHYVPEPVPDYILDLHIFEAKKNTIVFLLENP